MQTIHPQANIEKIPVLIRKVARELAGAFYEGSRSKEFRAAYSDPYLYIELQWPAFVTTAHEILVTMLESKGVSDREKDEIYDAITDFRAAQQTRH